MPLDPPPTASAALAQIERGRVAFNRGAFFEAHEIWEEVWRDARGAERRLLQGLIQIAAGLHHLAHGRPRPAARLLAKGSEKLAPGGSDLLSGLRLQDLRREVDHLLARLLAQDGLRDAPSGRGTFEL